MLSKINTVFSIDLNGQSCCLCVLVVVALVSTWIIIINDGSYTMQIFLQYTKCPFLPMIAPFLSMFLHLCLFFWFFFVCLFLSFSLQYFRICPILLLLLLLLNRISRAPIYHTRWLLCFMSVSLSVPFCCYFILFLSMLIFSLTCPALLLLAPFAPFFKLIVMLKNKRKKY